MVPVAKLAPKVAARSLQRAASHELLVHNDVHAGVLVVDGNDGPSRSEGNAPSAQVRNAVAELRSPLNDAQNVGDRCAPGLLDGVDWDPKLNDFLRALSLDRVVADLGSTLDGEDGVLADCVGCDGDPRHLGRFAFSEPVHDLP